MRQRLLAHIPKLLNAVLTVAVFVRQIGINPVTGTMVTGGIEAETAQVLANLEAVLIAGGMAQVECC